MADDEGAVAFADPVLLCRENPTSSEREEQKYENMLAQFSQLEVSVTCSDTTWLLGT